MRWRGRQAGALAVAPPPALAGDAAEPLALAAAAGDAQPAARQIVVPDSGDAVAAIQDVLAGYLTPSPANGIPPATVSVLQISDRTLGIGNSRGLQAVGPFSTVELYGGRIDCVVRFRVWAADSDGADTAMTALQGRLFSSRAELWNAGFLQFDGVAGTLAASDGAAWSRTADYHALVEYHLAPVSQAQSLIAAIPIRADHNGSIGETTTVTDDMVRWDQESAPGLVVRGPAAIANLALAAFLPTPAPGNAVELLRTNDAATGAPRDFPSIVEFLVALNDPVTPERHARVVFASLADFLDVFEDSGEMELGDWNQDGNADHYTVGLLSFDAPISLPDAVDRLQVALPATPLDHVGVVYLRASGTLG
jgi:hypothetical protein